MDYLPLFAAIKEKPVLVVGTGEIADRKIAFLQRAGAQVRVVAEADFRRRSGPLPPGERGGRPAVMFVHLPVDR